MIVDVVGPTIDRSLTLNFMGDWGAANLTRVCGWLVQELADRAGPETRCAIWNGRGGSDAIFAVGRGEVDVALCTPAAFARMAVAGTGPFRDGPFPNLRALGVVPQDDRLVVGLDASLGITTFAELREAAPALRIAASPDDGVNFVGLAAHTLMAAAGIDDATVEAWGGKYVEDERPFPCIERYGSGVCNAIVHEAIMAPHWRPALEERPISFLPVEASVLETLEREYGWPSGTVEPWRFPALETAFTTLDFRDFLVMTTTDLPDDVAHLLAWCLGETRQGLERQYRHIPPEFSPVTYPLDPVAMGTTPIALHDGAVAYYETLG
jgi:TRAP-type uncharacterized transport system substrate-binding protein